MAAPDQISPDERRTPGNDALTDAAQQLVAAIAGLALSRATASVSGLTGRLSDVAENGGSGLTTALRGSRAAGGPSMRSGLGGALGGIRDKITETVGGGAEGLMGKVTGALGGGGDDDEGDADGQEGGGGGGSDSGGGKKLKMTQIVEDLDIGLPLRTTYDLWTQYADFPSFMKKVESVEQASDETTNWTAKIVWSKRTWEATTLEQVPDSHIVFNSKGAKGHVDGAVTFTEIGPNLTRVLLVLEYWPKGLFERTGNIWRAQGRRARLEFQHFRRHAMTNVLLRQEEIEGWRGEIRDGEVVKTHEEALEEEQRAQDEQDDEFEGEGTEDAEYDDEESDEYEDADEAEDEDADEAEDEAEAADEESDEYEEADEPEDETDAVDEEADEEEEAEPEPEPEAPRRTGRGRGRRREPARAGR